MPKGGGKKSHKGKHRQFTNPEQLEEERKKESQAWRNKNESSSEGESSSDEDNAVEVNNPNYVKQKNKKLSELDSIPEKAPELSRRQKEEIQKQEAARRYQELHKMGKTEEARSDLARLAIIRKQREEAAKAREEEKKLKEERLSKSKEESLHAIKSKTGGPKRKGKR